MLHGNVLGEMSIHCGTDGGGVNEVVDIGNGQITLRYGAVTFINVNPQHSRPLNVNITCQPPNLAREPYSPQTFPVVRTFQKVRSTRC